MSRTRSHTYSSREPRTRVLMDHELMRDVLADVGAMRTALELELWASWMLGQTWKQRVRQPQFTDVDWMLTLGAPMVAMMAEIGGARARKALTAISLLERGALGNYAGAIALSLPGARTPRWMADIADARFARARHGVSAGDGEAVLLDLYRGSHHELTVGVFLDDRLDGAVKWIRLLGPVPPADPEPGPDVEPDLDPDPDCGPAADVGGDADPYVGADVEAPGMARAELADRDNPWALLPTADLGEVTTRLLAGIETADRDPRHNTLHEFADLRAFLLARLIDVSR